MRRMLSVLLAAVLLFTMGISFTGCGSAPDYKSPLEAVEAHKSGKNIIGKTVSVKASMDYQSIPLEGAGGVIYFQTSVPLSANIYVCPNGNTGNSVKEGQTVNLKVTDVDDHLEYSIYLMGDVI